MIDTVVLTINNPSFYSVEYVELKKRVQTGFSKQYFVPTAKQLAEYGYLPKFWLVNAVRTGGYQTFLQIEFSVTKLLFGNNFQEVAESDFDQVCLNLQIKLEKMGLIIHHINTIKDADVSVIHYSKNIVLQDYTTPYTYINELSKVNLSKAYDLNQTDYRNEGHALRYRASGFEVIFYDKMKDLEQAKKSERRAIGQDNKVQFDIYERLRLIMPFEVFRMEVRLGNKKKIKSVLTGVGFNLSYTFHNLFKVEISRSILLNVVEKVEAGYPTIISSSNHAELLNEIITNNPQKSLSQCLSYMSALLIINQSGSRELRAIVERFSPTVWYRLNRKLQGFLMNTRDNNIAVIRKTIEEFEQVELDSLLIAK
jgi:hypothetical protein